MSALIGGQTCGRASSRLRQDVRLRSHSLPGCCHIVSTLLNRSESDIGRFSREVRVVFRPAVTNVNQRGKIESLNMHQPLQLKTKIPSIKFVSKKLKPLSKTVRKNKMNKKLIAGFISIFVITIGAFGAISVWKQTLIKSV